MNTEVIQIDNLKCGGCANTIQTNLQRIKALKVNIDVEKSEVEVSSEGHIDRSEVVSILAKLGYLKLAKEIQCKR